MSTALAAKAELVEPAPQAPAPVASTETAAIFSLIERAARDPNVDIDKMERLFGMQREMVAAAKKAAFDEAFAAMQPELPVVGHRGRIVVKEKGTEKVIQATSYAKWEDISEAASPILARHGFGISFRTGQTPEGKITVTGILSHAQGHREETTMILPHDSTGSKNAVQAVGSSTSYGKRYTACALLNIVTRGEDDDGKAAGAAGYISDEQADELQKLIAGRVVDIDKFLRFMKVESISDIPAKEYESARALIMKKAVRS